MELKDLKPAWQDAGGVFKNEAELQQMMKISNHPSLKKIRTKLIVEIIGLLIFSIIYFDWFDGN
jgi:hypothetical protein